MAIYLKIEGIQGDSRNPEHGGWIELISLEYQLHGSPENPQGVQRLTISKHIDGASPLLLESCSQGRCLPRVVIEATRPDVDPYAKNAGRNHPTLMVKLDDAKLSDIRLVVRDSAADDNWLELLEIEYRRVIWEYRDDGYGTTTGQADMMKKKWR